MVGRDDSGRFWPGDVPTADENFRVDTHGATHARAPRKLIRLYRCDVS